MTLRKARYTSIAQSLSTILSNIGRWRRALATTLGRQPVFRSLALWMLGYPEAALADLDQALDARETGQVAPLMYVLGFMSPLHPLIGNYAAAAAQGQELLTLAEEKGASFWIALATTFQGCVSASTGKATDAVQLITSGLAYRWQRDDILVAAVPPFLAQAYAQLGKSDDALRCVGEAMHAVQTTKETMFEAEVYRMAGEIALMSPRAGCGESGRVFRARARSCARAAS